MLEFVTGDEPQHRNESKTSTLGGLGESQMSVFDAFSRDSFGFCLAAIDVTVCPPKGGPNSYPLFGGDSMSSDARSEYVTVGGYVTSTAERANKKDPRTWLPESPAGVSSSSELLTLVTRNSTPYLSSLVEFSGWGATIGPPCSFLREPLGLSPVEPCG